MDYSSLYDFNTTGGATTLQPPPQPQPNAAGSSFATRFHQLLMPLEELMAEWRVVVRTSPELAQDTISLLNNSADLTETRFILLNSILSSIGAQPEYYAPPTTALHYEPQPPNQLYDFVPPPPPPPTSTYPPLQQQQPWIGLTLVDPVPSMFTSILQATEEFSSTRELLSCGGGGRIFNDVTMPFVVGVGAPAPFDFLQLPTPLPTPTTPSSSSFPWSFLPSPSSNTPSPPAPLKLYTTPRPTPPPSHPAHLPPLNTQPLYLLIHSPSPPSPSPHVVDSPRSTPAVYELQLLASEPLGAESGEGMVLRLAWASSSWEGGKTKRIFEVEQRKGEVELQLRAEGGGEGKKAGEGEGEGEGVRILLLAPGTYIVPSTPTINPGSGDWWRSQICLGHHPLSPNTLYWTSTTSPPGSKTRKHRVLAHFETCERGRGEGREGLRVFARVLGEMSGGVRGRG